MKLFQFSKESPACGHIDLIQGGVLYGWAYRGSPSTTGTHSIVNIYASGQKIGQISANQYRADLEKNGYGDGECGFGFELPQHILNGSQVEISAEFLDSGNALGGGPVTFIGLQGQENDTQEYDWLKNPKFLAWEGVVSATIQAIGKISKGWSIKVRSKPDIGKVSYSLQSLTPPKGVSREANIPAVHIKSTDKVQGVELLADLRNVNTFYLTPLELKFIIYSNEGTLSKIDRIAVKRLAHGKFSTVFTISKNVMVTSQMRVIHAVIAPDQMIKAFRDLGEENLVLSIETTGNVDLVISDISIVAATGQRCFTENDAISFEDDMVNVQYNNIVEFMRFSSEMTVPQNVPSWEGDPSYPIVEIIVPVYNAKEYALSCLNSVINNTKIPYLLTIIDDGSSEDVVTSLEEFARMYPWVRLLKHEVNKGYTFAINTAIKSLRGEAAILLNSDTVVSQGWLEGMIECAMSSEAIGVVGPLSNAASWQSIPEIKDKSGGWAINSVPKGLDVNSFAEVVKETSEQSYPRVPVLNGFCFYIKKEVIDTIGYFDEVAFPQGYGEENDFCIRAVDAGYELAVVDDVYVFHHKSKTFGASTRKTLSTKANKILSERYGERMKELGADMKNVTSLFDLRERIKENLDSK